MATKMTFMDSAIQRIKHRDKAEWYSDKTYRGLRLCVTSGSKTWYASKWDGAAQKSRQIKIGQFPKMKRDSAWAKACEVKAEMDAGEHMSRAEKATKAVEEDAPLPTLAGALDAYLTHQTSPRFSGKSRMREGTAKEYRRSFELHLSTWAEIQIDKLPTRNLNQHLNTVQKKHPHAAYRAHAVIGATLRHACKVHAIVLPIPTLTDITKQPKREIDRTVDWADRWQEIETVENEIKRACWELRWHMGVRENVLRALTWAHVDLDAGTVTFDRLKRDDNGRTVAISTYSLSVFQRLRALHGSDWVFPSRRRINGKLGHLDVLDRLPLTAPGDVRHLWNEAAMSVVIPYHIQRWLNLQNLTGNEIAMLGHYGVPDLDSQRDAANKVSAYIMSRCKAAPCSVVEIYRSAS
ncbi:integrase arm-type DNA-binding domain-containing protein [Jannaschia sp.]|nr:integrase arm-type DNA-binding domain-containing protein [Jannaschia sp.]